MTEGALDYVINTAFVKTLINKTGFIDNLFSTVITILAGGKIRSDVFVGGKRSFEIDGDTGKAVFRNIETDGMLAENGTFKGRLEAAEGFFKGNLEAKSVSITDYNVTSGTAYLLKPNNNAVILPYIAGNTGTFNNVPLKVIRTPARGSCRIEAFFPSAYSEGVEHNNGWYKIVVNGTIITPQENGGWANIIAGSGGTLKTFDNISLLNAVNIIELYGSAWGTGSYFINSTLELKCSGAPGLLEWIG